MLDRVEAATRAEKLPQEQKYRKPLNQLRDVRTRKVRTLQDFQHFLNVSLKQGVTPAQLSGHFIQRYYYNCNKQLASLGARLFEGEERIGKLQCIDNLRALHILAR